VTESISLKREMYGLGPRSRQESQVKQTFKADTGKWQ